MAVAVEEKTSTEGAYSIYDSNEWDNEVIHQAIQEHQYHLTDRQKRYVGIKRVIDTCIAAVVLLILAIPFLLVAILQKINSPTESVFFLQDRVGLHGKVFKIIKFRTMKSSAPHNTATADLENAEMYLSRFGKALRRFSIDELPQLFNVLCGQMSLIGPRPLIVSEYMPAEKEHGMLKMYSRYISHSIVPDDQIAWRTFRLSKRSIVDRMLTWANKSGIRKFVSSRRK